MSIGRAYQDNEEKRVIHHLVNKMNRHDVPIQPRPAKTKTLPVVGGTRQLFVYKNVDFMNDQFLEFIRSFLVKLNIDDEFDANMIYDSSRKNAICFIDFDERLRIGFVIHISKALKAFYAFANPTTATKQERKILNSFTTHFEMCIEKINKNFIL